MVPSLVSSCYWHLNMNPTRRAHPGADDVDFWELLENLRPSPSDVSIPVLTPS